MHLVETGGWRKAGALSGFGEVSRLVHRMQGAERMQKPFSARELTALAVILLSDMTFPRSGLLLVWPPTRDKQRIPT